MIRSTENFTCTPCTRATRADWAVEDDLNEEVGEAMKMALIFGHFPQLSPKGSK